MKPLTGTVISMYIKTYYLYHWLKLIVFEARCLFGLLEELLPMQQPRVVVAALLSSGGGRLEVQHVGL